MDPGTLDTAQFVTRHQASAARGSLPNPQVPLCEAMMSGEPSSLGTCGFPCPSSVPCRPARLSSIAHGLGAEGNDSVALQPTLSYPLSDWTSMTRQVPTMSHPGSTACHTNFANISRDPAGSQVERMPNRSTWSRNYFNSRLDPPPSPCIVWH